MPSTRLKFESLPHAVFLQRVSDQSSATSLAARLGQGAFLALRLVDLLAPNREPVSDDAFHYQWVATDRFCRELRPMATEGAHVHGIASGSAEAWRQRDVQPLIPELFAYAHFLEDQLRLGEALDVLGTLLEIGGERLTAADAVAARLRLARVNRKLNQFEEAEVAYTEAGELATAAGDYHSALLSRIGRANTMMGRGNVGEAERTLRAVLADAQAAGERNAEARAQHGVAVALHQMGQTVEAVPAAWRAFELYDDDDGRLRALNDVGIMLLSLGDAVGAERALTEVVRRGAGDDSTNNATIELMHCASYRGDHLGFHRWRERCEARLADMPPNMRADFYLKQGIGQARFRRFRRAETLLKQAYEIATAHGLHQFEFRIERTLAGFGTCEQLAQSEAEPAGPVVQSDALREVTRSLALLGS